MASRNIEIGLSVYYAVHSIFQYLEQFKRDMASRFQDHRGKIHAPNVKTFHRGGLCRSHFENDIGLSCGKVVYIGLCQCSIGRLVIYTSGEQFKRLLHQGRRQCNSFRSCESVMILTTALMS